MRLVAVDTETIRETPWSVQLSDHGYPFGQMYYCDNPAHMTAVKGILEDPGVLTILHNAKFDLRVLGKVGVMPPNCECTMQMAYLLGESALSLKVLAYRIAHIQMRTFDEVTYKATQIKAKQYLEEVLDIEWPDPDPIMETGKDGEIKLSFPTNIRSKVKARFKKADADPDVDLYKSWGKIEIEKGRGQVEEVMGEMQRAYLDEVDQAEAESYALLDAEATLAIYPYLHDRIQELGLQEVLERDMGSLPMVMAMEDNGVYLDVGVLKELEVELTQLAEDTQIDINYIANKYVNPRSSQQVVAMLQEMGIYGWHETSTDATVMDQYKQHTIVGKVQDYRGYTKLLSTYVLALMKSATKDGKIHTTFSTTRTETGRLASSKPNLQNIPVRTELGRRIRQAFVSERSE